MDFEIQYFDACPSWQDAETMLAELLVELGIDSSIQMRAIETHEDAIQHHFPGSPTFRLDGSDIFPVSHSDYALGCRVYETPDGMRGLPTRAMLRERLVELTRTKHI
jgi:hypothetical protein